MQDLWISTYQARGLVWSLTRANKIAVTKSQCQNLQPDSSKLAQISSNGSVRWSIYAHWEGKP